jgi:hypothetical protein
MGISCIFNTINGIRPKTAGLFVDPESVEVTEKRVVVLAQTQTVVTVTPFIQNNGQVGKVDEQTRVPTFVESDQRGYLTDDQKRWLYRIDGAGVRPLVRHCYDDYGRRAVFADGRLDFGYGVGGLSQAQAEPAVVEKILVQPNCLAALLKTADLSESAVAKLEETTLPELLAPIKELIRKTRAIELKE